MFIGAVHDSIAEELLQCDHRVKLSAPLKSPACEIDGSAVVRVKLFFHASNHVCQSPLELCLVYWLICQGGACNSEKLNIAAREKVSGLTGQSQNCKVGGSGFIRAQNHSRTGKTLLNRTFIGF